MTSQEAPQAEFQSLQFGSKAGNLLAVSDLVRNGVVPPCVVVKLSQFISAPDEAVETTLSALGTNVSLAVRSSCRAEDATHASNAGAFLTLLNVSGSVDLKSAIGQVFASYPAKDLSDEVFVQPMITDVAYSGVVFSHDPETGAPYITINYSRSGDTQAVTSGTIEGGNLQRWHRSGRITPSGDVEQLIRLVEELENLFDSKFLDIEFAKTSDGTLYLLQVRPITTTISNPVALDDHVRLLEKIQTQLENCHHRNPFLLGDKPVFGVMPDWNPAEIIGPRPRPLALSLYRRIITDNIWAYQRNNYGYRNLRSCPLLIDFHGLPYVDVRVSFNSFLPKSLDEDIASKLANHYLETLIAKPELHDKVEFEIVLSCFSFDIEERLAELPGDIFAAGDRHKIKTSLIDLTANIIHSDTALWKKDLAKLDVLSERRIKLLGSDADHASKIYWLLEDCQRYGTLPFAGIARAAFIAVRLLKSLVTTDVLSQDEADLFLRSVSTVTSSLTQDCANLDKAQLIEKYGHLRPGTYDILSPSYGAAFDSYFGEEPSARQTNAPGHASGHETFRLSMEQINAIEILARKFDLPFNAVDLLNFMTDAIEAREHAKFEFSKNLSAAIDLFAEYGADLGFSRQDLSYAGIDTIYEIYRSCDDPTELLQTSITMGKAKFERGKTINLPALIWDTDQIWDHVLPVTRGNYVTEETVVSNVVDCNAEDDLKGKIIKILNADPGYDWIFSRDIAGFVTAYGGLNSHMAIRARELHLPAAIGIGEPHYNEIEPGKIVRMDCSAELIVDVR